MPETTADLVNSVDPRQSFGCTKLEIELARRLKEAMELLDEIPKIKYDSPTQFHLEAEMTTEQIADWHKRLQDLREGR